MPIALELEAGGHNKLSWDVVIPFLIGLEPPIGKVENKAGKEVCSVSLNCRLSNLKICDLQFLLRIPGVVSGVICSPF